MKKVLIHFQWVVSDVLRCWNCVDSILCLTPNYYRAALSVVFAGAMCCLRPNKNLQWNTNKKKADKKIEDNSRNRQCRRRMLILIKVLAFFWPSSSLFSICRDLISSLFQRHMCAFPYDFCCCCWPNEECFACSRKVCLPFWRTPASSEASSKLCNSL